MTLFSTVSRIIVIIVLVSFMMIPFLLEGFTFWLDEKREISYKRFRLVVFTIIYVIAVTILFYVLKEAILWLESTRLVQWFVVRIAARTAYCAKVIATVMVNIAIGALYWILSKFVRIGMKKKDLVHPKKKKEKKKKEKKEKKEKKPFKFGFRKKKSDESEQEEENDDTKENDETDTDEPEDKEKRFSLSQRIERKVIRFFNNETWFLVGRIVKWLSILLSAAYIIIFIEYLLPAMFGADWIPYNFISMLFSAGYIYPTITLLVLWEIYFFLEGIKRVEDECPELLKDEDIDATKLEEDLKAIDNEIRKYFGDFYACEVDISKAVHDEVSSADHHPVTKLIADSIESDERNPQPRKEVYLDCTDKLVGSEKSLLINGSLFSEFSMYFLRYIAMVVARGDNVIFVCNSDMQIDSVYDYLRQGLSEISSLYCKDFSAGAVNLDDPIWRIVKVSGEHSVIEESAVDDSSILVTSLGYLCSDRFEANNSRFISTVDVVIFVDALNTVNRYPRQLAILNTYLQNIIRKNSLAAKNSNGSDKFRVRYMSRKIRYICFGDSRTPGLDKTLKTAFGIEKASDFITVDSMSYGKKAMVRCYNYESKTDEEGKQVYTQFLNTEERVGVVMNMAILCLIKGAKSVTVFTDDTIPYGNIAETISANMGRITVDVGDKKILLNKQFYNPNGYSVIIAIDSNGNLPEALRRYTAMVSDEPVLIIVFSENYMLRDYFVSNINVDDFWCKTHIERIPSSEENTKEKTKKSFAQNILIKANAGGISRDELLSMAGEVKEFKEAAKNGDVNAILREILEVYGVSREDRLMLYRYFDFVSKQDFDEAGNYSPETLIVLERRGKLFDSINGLDMIAIVIGGKRFTLQIPRSRLTQNYIEGQNLVYNGNIYTIDEIDTEKGEIKAGLAVSGMNNEVYKYIQAREYRVEMNPAETHTKHILFKAKKDNISITDVYLSEFRVPMEVITRGYYVVNPHTLSVDTDRNQYYSISDPGNDELCRQTYRRYGIVSNPYYSSDSDVGATALNVSQENARLMSVRIVGELGGDVNKIMSLAAMMLNETLHSMFPSVADSVVVCPVIHGEMSGEDAEDALCREPRVEVVGESELISATDFELLIIEDCAEDLGVVSALMSGGDDALNTLFKPIRDYLKWYLGAEEKSDYLCQGLGHEPDCFDFDSLHKLSTLLSDKNDIKFVSTDEIVEYTVCDFCGKRYSKGDDIVVLGDGRQMCKACAGNLVGNNKKVLKSHLEDAKRFLESTYGIVLDDDCEFCYESTAKIINTLRKNNGLLTRGTDIPLRSYVEMDKKAEGGKKKVHVEYSVPSVSFSELLVRELTHTWQLKHLPELSEDLAEGHIALVAIQYLRFLEQDSLADIRTTYYESTSNPSGVGYRKLVAELLENPQFNNNPFRYLLEVSGTGSDGVIVIEPRVIGEDDYGKRYEVTQLDRALDGNLHYFYYDRLTATQQKAYDILLEAVQNHSQSTSVYGCSYDDVVRVMEAVNYDHPELFWYRNIAIGGSEVIFYYGASKEESDVLQKRINDEVPKYLEGIDDTMSAYDVAMRIHAKLIAAVDYDTVGLNEQKKQGGSKNDEIDYLRSICGVFLNGKAVCAGYARAMQYLLQKCGIESGYVAGYMKEKGPKSPDSHAWNIVKLDGDYYYFDVTWDDSSNTVQKVKNTDFGFNYFAITTEEILRTRNIDLCPVEMPLCTATKANYFYHNDLVLTGYDVGMITSIAMSAAESGHKSFTFKCKTKEVYDTTMKKLCTGDKDGLNIIRNVCKYNKQISEGYSYTYDKDILTITIKFKFK